MAEKQDADKRTFQNSCHLLKPVFKFPDIVT